MSSQQSCIDIIDVALAYELELSVEIPELVIQSLSRSLAAGLTDDKAIMMQLHQQTGPYNVCCTKKPWFQNNTTSKSHQLTPVKKILRSTVLK